LKADQILAVIQSGGRWPILEHGVTAHFQQDYVSAVHLLIPQFENTVLECAGACGIDTKRFDKGVPGEILLNHLIQPDNAKMQALLEADLFDLIYWYMLKSDGPFSYRHKLAHGWINIGECTVQLSSMTLWLTLQVVSRTLSKRLPNKSL
jgi:hypothetical protein